MYLNINKMDSNNTFKCDLCSFSTCRLSSFTRHLKEKHGIEDLKKKKTDNKQPKQENVLDGLNIKEVKEVPTANLKTISTDIKEQQQAEKENNINVGNVNKDVIIRLHSRGKQTQEPEQEEPQKIANLDTTVTLGMYLKSVLQEINILKGEISQIYKWQNKFNKKLDLIVSRMSRICFTDK